MAGRFDDETDLSPALRASLPPAVARRGARLTVRDARGAREYELTTRLLAGAAATVDVVLAEPTASRLHAEFEWREDGVWVRDLGSRNGTFVQGVRVLAAQVPDGATVRLGNAVVHVRHATEAATVELWPSDRFGALVGGSAAMRELFARLARASGTDATVLVRGETGTGKELVARALHEQSPRRDGPLVVVDCAALPEQLLEAELFGHTKGAFTGAVAARGGAFEAADGGTIFLDEIGELPLAMQPKLLRALESRTVRRLGEAQHRKVDIRVIAATHRDLRTMVNEGGFREDLYFRVAVVPVTVPPLRERAEDIPALVHHFAGPHAAGVIAPELLRELAARPWYGNVRELRNFVERAITLGPREALSLDLAPGARGGERAEPTAGRDGAAPPISIDEPFKTGRERWVAHYEREYFRRMLARHDRNISAVAQAAGVVRAWVYALIRKHDL